MEKVGNIYVYPAIPHKEIYPMALADSLITSMAILEEKNANQITFGRSDTITLKTIVKTGFDLSAQCRPARTSQSK